MPELNARYIGSQNKFIGAELVMADVCAECNNKKLSPLDAYFCSLFDQYFQHSITVKRILLLGMIMTCCSDAC
ncbi:hypothetical protein [Pedobacter polysacchareus]|uniref:hypothetical protein n=1 Tax=Pedobacter polysacchareus TaxID=2861973 RepID=UPI001C99194C|nr:hypothetical protein [Pedobacter polysacchareus]